MTRSPEAVRVSAIHLGGIRSLEPRQGGVELRFSEAGLQIFAPPGQAPLGLLSWTEIESIELPRRRGLRRRGTTLSVATAAGQARFELPGLTRRQVRQHLGAMLARVGGADPTG